MIPGCATTSVNPSTFPSLRNVLVDLGLTGNLKLVLDAGDENSYSSGQKWLDRAGGGYDFFLGADGAATGTDPTFNGNRGGLSAAEYFSTDGGDYFTYDTTNETWMKSLGKLGSVTFVAVVYLPADATTHIISTIGGGAVNGGMEMSYDPITDRMVLRYTNSTPGYSSFGFGPNPYTIPGLYFLAVSCIVNADGSFTVARNVNGSGATASGAAGSLFLPTGDPVGTMHLLSHADVSEIAPSGTKLYALAVWQGTALTQTQMTNIWDAIHARFGL